ncbi:hypothetical protein SAMN04488066_1198 [Halorubrum aquaticum]|uniref:DUF7993 domain-containing protein n=1 Tax=Halorubrum aquaticum TaxID=387340 RepID=A0A1I3C5P4_9EURY|nr:hypothetical protein [Halorubrum aquaticum]SFH69646.1 hypothetical protein SAMN04488066_1198 [Halorubrum aquaticum]
MVEDRLTDGVRIGQLLASEVTGDRGRLRGLDVTDADPDVEPTADGALAFRLVEVAGGGDGDDLDDDDSDCDSDGDGDCDSDGDGDCDSDADGDPDEANGADAVADVYVQPDRVRIEFRRAPEAVAEAAGDAGLRVRPKAVRPPRTLVFLEDGADVKRVLPAVERVVGSGSEP